MPTNNPTAPYALMPNGASIRPDPANLTPLEAAQMIVEAARGTSPRPAEYDPATSGDRAGLAYSADGESLFRVYSNGYDTAADAECAERDGPFLLAAFNHAAAVAQAYIVADGTGVKLMRQYLAALARIDQLESERRWIPVSEGPPPRVAPYNDSVEVLIIEADGDRWLAHFDHEIGDWYPDGHRIRPTHYQYLPPAPAQ